jgi:hypothetical protein
MKESYEWFLWSIEVFLTSHSGNEHGEHGLPGECMYFQSNSSWFTYFLLGDCLIRRKIRTWSTFLLILVYRSCSIAYPCHPILLLVFLFPSLFLLLSLVYNFMTLMPIMISRFHDCFICFKEHFWC